MKCLTKTFAASDHERKDEPAMGEEAIKAVAEFLFKAAVRMAASEVEKEGETIGSSTPETSGNTGSS